MKQITKELWEKAAQAGSDDSWEGQQRFIERLVDLTVDEDENQEEILHGIMVSVVHGSKLGI